MSRRNSGYFVSHPVNQIARQMCRRITVTLFAFAALLLPFAARAEKANVFFIHGAM